MKIEVRWSETVDLCDASELHQIYGCDDLSRLPDEPGVYVFGRRYGLTFTPLYVGQAGNLRSRICQQFNNLRLMKAIESSGKGARVVMVAPLRLLRGQQSGAVLDVVELALIEQFMASGFELINKQGTRIPQHSLTFKGNRAVRRLLPASMKVRKA
jgi:hypothetical protein